MFQLVCFCQKINFVEEAVSTFILVMELGEILLLIKKEPPELDGARKCGHPVLRLPEDPPLSSPRLGVCSGLASSGVCTASHLTIWAQDLSLAEAGIW